MKNLIVSTLSGFQLTQLEISVFRKKRDIPTPLKDGVNVHLGGRTDTEDLGDVKLTIEHIPLTLWQKIETPDGPKYPMDANPKATIAMVNALITMKLAKGQGITIVSMEKDVIKEWHTALVAGIRKEHSKVDCQPVS